MQSLSLVLFDSSQNNSTKNWRIINDGVMGGRSEGYFELTTENSIHYKGFISLKNNGGFSSLRYDLAEIKVSGKSKIRLTVKGDNKKYQFRIVSKENSNFAYITYFTTKDEVEVIDIPLSELFPSFRGRKLDLPNFEDGYLTEIGFLFGNKKEEPFSLEIQKIEYIED